ncbi:mannitol dehydrogenase family protein [Nonomuraea sp. 3N208]|uniref:mannitol dehydrogenase family protein n=1 Tax=Nonomuraea sp. 3N208 TaxID=3457421 RepID=UPI003FD54EFD
MVTRLRRAVLPRIDPALRPVAEPRSTGIVHLGLGAFHRAHQAVFTEDAMAATGDDRWGICGFSQRSAAVRDRLAPQDGLYTVQAKDDAEVQLRVLGPLREVRHAGDDPDVLTARLTAEATQIVSLTVTEKGYLGGGVIGRLVRGLEARAAADAGPLTVLCCDNIPQGGAVLAGLVDDFCARRGTAAHAWIHENVRFPSSMVDRIVPAATASDRAEAATRLGFDDHAPVVTEPFRQWVIEDDFASDRPAWEAAGALLVADVSPYERMKLRLLNGSHSMLAYLGGLAGKEHIADAMAEPAFAELAGRLMDDDITPTLYGLDGFDLRAYKRSLLNRFANRGLRHRTAQVATDGTQKLPQRLLDPARDCLAAGREPLWIALAIAAWMRYVSAGHTDDGAPIIVHDPLSADIHKIVAARPDPRRMVDELLSVFGGDLGADRDFRGLVVMCLERLIKQGAAPAVRSLLRGAG